MTAILQCFLLLSGELLLNDEVIEIKCRPGLDGTGNVLILPVQANLFLC
jgi:hypothetical protein